MKLPVLLSSVTALALTSAALVFAQDGAGDAAMPPGPRPGPQHEVIARKAGTWDAQLTMPGMPAGAVAGRAVYTARLDHGGLWLIGDYRGDFMGAPFSGTEVQGFDATKGKYVSTWVDSWIDHVMRLEGDFDAASSTLQLWTENTDRATGAPIRERHDTHFVDADHWTFAILQPGADGTLAPVMTIKYSRRAEGEAAPASPARR